MSDLIKALQIMLKYGNPNWPTHCEHDVMYICGIDPNDVSEEDIEQLDELGFHVDDEFGEDQFKSYKFGNA
jgi:hypothetical protein